MRIFVAGATGYVGARLVPRLLDLGHDVAVLSRSAARVAARPWGARVDVVEGDATNSRVVTGAMDGVDVVVHLVHAMEDQVSDFREVERRTARTIASSAALAGVDHIVYLGGLVPASLDAPDELSPHLASRVATGQVLADAGPPTTELRASLVLGAGSASYELVRFVAQTPFPVMVHPTWATGRCQPIGITDLLDMMVAVIVEAPPERHHRIIEVGGPEVGVYHDLVEVMREIRGGVPTISSPIPTLVSPVLTGQLLATLTPIDPGTVAPLVASLAHDSVVTGAYETAIGETTVAQAIRHALGGEGEYASMTGDPPWVGATLDLALVARVMQRLPRLPARLLPRLQRDQLLATAVDVVTTLRPS